MRRCPSRNRLDTVTPARLALALAGASLAGLPVAAQQPAGAPLVFDGVTVVDVEHGQLLPDQRVVVTGNRIQTVGSAGSVPLPKGAQVIDAKTKFLIPGLWDLHTHPRSYTQLFYPLFIANGVTGFRDAWSDWPIDSLALWWRAILAGKLVGPPRQLLTGSSEEIHQGSTGDLTDEEIRSLKSRGANFIKLYPFDAGAASRVRKAGLPFGGHMDGVSAIEASDSGAAILDHVNSAGDLDQVCLGPSATVDKCRPVAEHLRRNNSWWVPTLIRRMSFNRQAEPNPGAATQAVSERMFAMADQFWNGTAPQGNWLHGMADPGKGDSLRFLAVAKQASLPILSGTDAGAPVRDQEPPGFALHAELAIYVTEGLSPLEALQAATINPAKMLHGTDSLGTVAAGKLADLVLLDANPLADITNTTTIRAVVANGRYFDRAALDRLFTEVQAAAKQAP
jgi:hypothetical protein